jgi:hypothetical protein
MRLRLGLLLGTAIGYVLGAKAGRERYEQIMSGWRSFKGSEPAQQISAEVREVAQRASHQIETKAAEGVSKVTELVRGSGNDADGSSL